MAVTQRKCNNYYTHTQIKSPASNLKTKFVLINQRRFQHAENSILAITSYNIWKENSFLRHHYFCISCIDHFKTNVAWIHHNIHEILLLPSLYLSSQNIIRENQVVHRSRQGIWYSIIEIFSILDIYSHNFNYSGALENKQQAGGVFGLTPRNQGYWRSSIFCQFIYFLSFL